MSLTDAQIRNAKPSSKVQRLWDGNGLYLEVLPSGSKLWRFKYRLQGKEKRLSLGAYPVVPLSNFDEERPGARQECARLKGILARGTDPADERKREAIRERAAGETFESITREWYAEFKHTFSPAYAVEVLRRLEKDIFPWLGAKPIHDITAPEILAVVRRIKDRGAPETARRQLQKIGQVYAFAIASGKAERNPATDIKGALAPPEKKHFAALTNPIEIAPLLRAIDGYQGSHVVRCALRLAPLLFVRPGELRHAEWGEVELDSKFPTWRIPKQKMKAKRPHLVPLARQSVEILEELRPLTGSGKWLFPGNRGDKCISSNTLNAALRYLGFTGDQMTVHGFRSMASTLLNETGWDADVIEAQLAHTPGNAVRAAYNRSQYLAQRREMMQSWADFLDTLKETDGFKVLPLFRAG